MKVYLTQPINLPVKADCLDVKARLAAFLGIRENQIQSFSLYRRSVDARRKDNVHWVCSYLVQCRTPKRNAAPYVAPQDVLLTDKPRTHGSVIIVGAGPSGLFAAKYLAACGVKVTVVERGSTAAKRVQKVKSFFDGGSLDEECNVQFGLGGAGTFSDGKLTTGISSPLVYTVFSELVRCGAPQCITYDALPHVGTDNLVSLSQNMMDGATAQGCEFLTDTKVTELVVKNGRAVGVTVTEGATERRLYADCVMLCCGHSARELFHELVKQGAEVQFKPFAVGLRIEHKRSFIDFAQYGATHRDVGAASYKLTYNRDGRGCYSFCMCPGGQVVCASSAQKQVVVNGMSNFARDAENSNSALVVTVNEGDMARWGYGGALGGVQFQRQLEENCYRMGGGNFKAPCQTVSDFLSGKTGGELPVRPSYPRGVTSANLFSLFPQEISSFLAEALVHFGGKIRGFDRDALLTGVESRTSSPVKVVRNKFYQSNVAALFPVGEGCGHSGGIVSSAADGLRAAEFVRQFLCDGAV